MNFAKLNVTIGIILVVIGIFAYLVYRQYIYSGIEPVNNLFLLISGFGAERLYRAVKKSIRLSYVILIVGCFFLGLGGVTYAMYLQTYEQVEKECSRAGADCAGGSPFHQLFLVPGIALLSGSLIALVTNRIYRKSK